MKTQTFLRSLSEEELNHPTAYNKILAIDKYAKREEVYREISRRRKLRKIQLEYDRRRGTCVRAVAELRGEDPLPTLKLLRECFPILSEHTREMAEREILSLGCGPAWVAYFLETWDAYEPIGTTTRKRKRNTKHKEHTKARTEPKVRKLGSKDPCVWTDEMVFRSRKMLADGLSISEIGNVFETKNSSYVRKILTNERRKEVGFPGLGVLNSVYPLEEIRVLMQQELQKGV